MQAPQEMVVGQVAVTGSGRPTQMMSYFGSIKTCMKKYVDFNGRAAKSEYWWFFLFNIIVSVVTSIVDIYVTDTMLTPTLGTIQAVALFGLLLPSIAVAARRLHDVGKSGWMLLITLIPLIGVIVLLVWLIGEGDAQPNVYGVVPTNFVE